MLRPGHPAEVADADLALPRTAVSTQTFTETHDIAPSQMVLTTRAVGWATSALSWDDTTVSALARQLGVDWHTCWDAVEVEARARTSDPARLQKVGSR